MRKIYTLLGAVFMLCLLFNVAQAQDAASATWPLTEASALTVTEVGSIDAEEEKLNNTEINQYTGADASQRIRIKGNSWPINQTDTITATNIQFSVAPTTGKTLNVTSVSFGIGAHSLSNMKARVFYSTDPSFKTATEIEFSTSLDNNYLSTTALTSVSATPNVTVNAGESFYLRIYPWVNNEATAKTGKYVTLKDVVISGTTTEGDGGEPTEAAKVAYVTYKKDMAPTAAPTENDPIIQMLKADENIDLTVIAVETANGTADISGFDVVVVQEGFGSGDAILKPSGSLALSAITVPFLYNKTYALRNDRAVVTGGGTSAEATGLAIMVPEANRENELFNGITFTDGAFNVFKSTAADNGGEGDKTFNYTHGLTLSADNTLLGTAPEVATADAATTIFLNDVPAGTTIGDQTTQARMIAVGMNMGAISKDNGTNLTAEGLTLWRNAVYTLAGLEVPNTLVDPGVVTSIEDKVAGATFSLGQNYPNPFHGSTTIEYEIKKSGYVALEVYDALGRKVATLADGNQAAGTYEVKLNKNLSNGMYFYKLSANGSSLTRRMLVTQ